MWCCKMPHPDISANNVQKCLSLDNHHHAKLKSLCRLQGGDPFTKELKVRGLCWSTVVTVVAVKMEEVAE